MILRILVRTLDACKSLLEFMERDSRIMLGLECLVRVGFRSGSGVLFLYELLLILNSVGSWTLVKPDAMPSTFWGKIRANELKDNKLH